MKKILIFAIFIFLISGCVLVPEIPSTPFPPTQTLGGSTPPPTATIKHTETPVEQLIPTNAPIPTFTTVPTIEPSFTNTPQVIETPFPFESQSVTPAYIKNFGHPSEGCDWMGVAGQVFDENMTPLLNSVVLIYGKINGKIFENMGVTGVPEADIYGPGGYEIKISDQVFASKDLLAIQIFDLNGIPISEVVFFETFADCGKNLIIINFQHKD